MARDKPEEPNSGDIPAWFMTYSDVITLLMTFFILLMTFSTTEPENFGRMQVVMFGGGNSSGVARQVGPRASEGLAGVLAASVVVVCHPRHPSEPLNCPRRAWQKKCCLITAPPDLPCAPTP